MALIAKSLIAKSGRRYRKIPEGYDVELWDKMTPIERMKVLGVLIGKEGFNNAKD